MQAKDSIAQLYKLTGECIKYDPNYDAGAGDDDAEMADEDDPYGDQDGWGDDDGYGVEDA